ncbi:BlaI/MecI/CopY family transcriptional regulator [Mycolicibacterium palauense]|uniref:BlaI/MecI/CopY family transcriptional regulator n=1 Tax=Mycolicibacterium palauense TaxID=2034511 RepID=UPI000BFF09A6|nr:BlaI/MecI/CopY family transcriptional regulator [Mycolicibacterium palauense]
MRKEPGGLEEAVIGVLDADDYRTVAEVRAALGGSLAHTTVMTALVRLTRKGVLTRAKRGRGYGYALAAPAGDLPALRAAIRMRHALDGRQDRASVLASFVASLQPDDEEVLRTLLERDPRTDPQADPQTDDVGGDGRDTRR